MLVGLIAIVALASVRTLGETLAGDGDPDAEVNFTRITTWVEGSGGIKK